MAIPSTGSIRLKNVENEFGGSGSISLSEYYYSTDLTNMTSGYNIPSSGPISLSGFRGVQSYNFDFITSIDGNATTSNPGGSFGSVNVNISNGAGRKDRWIFIAAGFANAGSVIIYDERRVDYSVNGVLTTTVFNSGFKTDDDGHRIAIGYRKIGDNDTSVNISWSSPFNYKPDRGHGIFIYEIAGIPSMGTINSATGSGGRTADLVLVGSKKRSAIFITVANFGGPATTMTNCEFAGSIAGRHSSFYDVNMGDGTLTYSTNELSGNAYGCFGGISIPY